MTSHLVALLDEHKRATGVSDAELARRIGITRQALTQWRSTPLRRLPERATLEAVAAVTGRPYAVVLDAVLRDTGYAGAAGVRPYEVVHADVIAVLTEAARLSWPARRFSPATGWVTNPDAAPDPVDWAQFVATALTAAAANVGGTETALRGRPGSWEADAVRQLVDGTGGEDIAGWRTEPLRITVAPAAILVDVGYAAVYDVSRAVLASQRRDHVWEYRYDTGAGEWVAESPDAPTLSINPGTVPVSGILAVPRTDADIRILDELGELEEALDDLEFNEIDLYGRALRETVLAQAATDGVDVDVVVIGGYDPMHTETFDAITEERLRPAILSTPLPSGLKPVDYPPGQRIADVDAEHSRLPHLRIDRTSA